LLGMVLLGVVPGFNAVLRARPLRFVGRVSYGLYVFHPLAFLWTFHELAGVPWIVRGPAGYLVALAMAIVSWYAYERYFIRLKDKFAPEPRPTPHAPLSV